MSPYNGAAADQPHYVYRCFDSAGRLLYIGCTSDVVGRMQTHRASWHVPASAKVNMHTVRHETVEYPDRASARKAEREAIESEAPMFNVLHNQGRELANHPDEKPGEMSDLGMQLARVLEGFGRTA